MITHGVKVGSRPVDSDTSPDNGGQTHLSRNRSDTIIDIPIRRSESIGSHTRHILDNFLCPSQFRDDLLIRQFSEVGVRPSMYGELMAGHIFRLDHFGSRDHAGTDEEESGGELLGVEVVEQ